MCVESFQEAATANVVNNLCEKNKNKSFCLSVKTHEIDGKSPIPFAYPHKSLQLVSEKHYSKYRNPIKINDDAMTEFYNSYVAKPFDKFDDTVLESHRYGWYSHVRFDIKLDYVALLKSKPKNLCSSLVN